MYLYLRDSGFEPKLDCHSHSDWNTTRWANSVTFRTPVYNSGHIVMSHSKLTTFKWPSNRTFKPSLWFIPFSFIYWKDSSNTFDDSNETNTAALPSVHLSCKLTFQMNLTNKVEKALWFSFSFLRPFVSHLFPFLSPFTYSERRCFCELMSSLKSRKKSTRISVIA
jgi:hypothetical protein